MEINEKYKDHTNFLIANPFYLSSIINYDLIDSY